MVHLPELADSCHLHPLTRATTVGAVGFCAHMGKVAIRIFEHVSAVSAEHKLSRLSHEQTRRMTAAWRTAEERLIGCCRPTTTYY